MTDKERLLLLETARHVTQLFGDRDDLIIGVTAAVLDLYRAQFLAGYDTKEAAIQRLRVQCDAIDQQVGDDSKSRYLKALISALEKDALDAAALLRVPVAGTA